MGLGDMIHKRPRFATARDGDSSRRIFVASVRCRSTVAPLTGMVAPCGARDALPIVVANTVTGSTNSLYRISGRDAQLSWGNSHPRGCQCAQAVTARL